MKIYKVTFSVSLELTADSEEEAVELANSEIDTGDYWDDLDVDVEEVIEEAAQ